MSSYGIVSVETYTVALEKLMGRARQIKQNTYNEPALVAADLAGGIQEIEKLSGCSFVTNNQAHYAAIETACRNIFYNLLVR